MFTKNQNVNWNQHSIPNYVEEHVWMNYRGVNSFLKCPAPRHWCPWIIDERSLNSWILRQFDVLEPATLPEIQSAQNTKKIWVCLFDLLVLLFRTAKNKNKIGRLSKTKIQMPNRKTCEPNCADPSCCHSSQWLRARLSPYFRPENVQKSCSQMLPQDSRKNLS